MLGEDKEGGNACLQFNQKARQVQIALECIAMLVVGIIGIIGNTLAIYIFSNLKKQMKFHQLMIMIFVFDTSFIILTLMIYSFPHMSDEYKYGDTYCHMLPIITPLQEIALTGSIYSTMAISIERYLVVCHPFYTLSNRWSSKRYILPIIAFSVLYNIPRFYELEVQQAAQGNVRTTTGATPIQSDKTADDKPMYSVEHTDLRVDYYYNSIYRGWINLFATAIIPFLVLITLNTLIFKKLKDILSARSRESVVGTFGAPGSLMAQSSYHPDEEPACVPVPVSPRRVTRANEILLAKVSIIIVLFFVICHSVRWIPIIYGIVYNHYLTDQNYVVPEWLEICINVSGILTVANSSVNFYIYILTHFHVLPSDEFFQCFFCKTGSAGDDDNQTLNGIPLLHKNGNGHENKTKTISVMKSDIE